uniref:SREBP regulating gene protein n=1 Tax=Hirondellea gigas TaxID=1518452 RepID=A0A2P2I1Z0_9CRUS
MLAARVARMLRNKFICLVLVGGLLLYCCCVLLDLGLGAGDSKVTGDSDTTIRRRAFDWDEHNDASNSSNNITENASEAALVTCRNSVQGKALLADDRGYVCQRLDRLGTGCCNAAADNSHRYHCLTCNAQHCCAIYEYCVSCCMHPDKKSLLKRVLKQVSEGSPLYASVSDQFELCLVKCRTSSQSVQHETLYRDPRSKHCYGERVPVLLPEGDA